MGLTNNRLYKVSRGNQGQAAGAIVIGGTGTTIYGSQETPTEFADMADLNGEAMAAGFHTFVILPEYILLDGDADSVQMIGVSLEDTETDITS